MLNRIDRVIEWLLVSNTRLMIPSAFIGVSVFLFDSARGAAASLIVGAYFYVLGWVRGQTVHARDGIEMVERDVNAVIDKIVREHAQPEDPRMN